MVRRASRAPESSRADEIRRATLHLFAEKGYAGTTMADIAHAVGIRAPSIYNHVPSKQQLLLEIILGTLDALNAGLEAALSSTPSPREQFRRAFEAHVRFHARHKEEAFVGTRETRSLEGEASAAVLRRSAAYERRFRELIQAGVDNGDFVVPSVHLASCALLDMGIGVSSWYQNDKSTSEDELVYEYCELALRVVGLVTH
jgi:AcrR family transcriptional regulator